MCGPRYADMKSVLAPLVATAVVACTAVSPENSRTPLAVEAVAEPARPRAEVPAGNGTIQWIGGPTAVIERGGLRLMTDPMLGPRGPNAFTLPRHPSSGVADAPVTRYTEHVPVSLSGLDVILVSHTHNDHVDARAKELLPKNVPVVVAAAGATMMREAGFRDVRPLDWGENATFTEGGTSLRIVAVPAHHAHVPALDQELGRGNGYVLEFRDAGAPYRIYVTGDAVITDDSRDFTARYGALDLLLPHLGGVGGDGGHGLRTMDAEEAVELVRRVAPRWIIPIHHTTFGHYREPIEALEQRAGEAGLGPRFRFLREGETTALPGSGRRP
jgi:L-ascorbate metabolism protein UlaG (beta-lactamase superfamily)